MANLFYGARLSGPTTSPKPGPDRRTEFERDYDRILFSAPVRRLADKTQVFPLEKNDSVRTRLTHSHEVSNLCRSLATQIVRTDKEAFGAPDLTEQVPVIAAAVGLAHDLGNPPFGHQGEKAIQRWFERNPQVFSLSGEKGLSEQQEQDFLAWEGNAQALRLLTRLQVTKGSRGLDLTYATLAALMKYTVPSTQRAKKVHPARKKFGYFQADQETAEQVLSGVGLAAGLRHPLAYLMEACDDIAYSVIDIEDAVKKGLISINDVIVTFENAGPAYSTLVDDIQLRINELRKSGRSASDVNEIGSQYYRTFTIQYMVNAVVKAFLENKPALLGGDFENSLIDASDCSELCSKLKDFAREHAYNSPSVKELELKGDNLLGGLMDHFWRGIRESSLEEKKYPELRKRLGEPAPSPFGLFVFSHISRNYVASFESELRTEPTEQHARYHQLLLLTDMVSGMTENFALDLYEKFQRVHDGAGS